MIDLEVHDGSGAIAFDNAERKLPHTKNMDFEDDEWLHIPKSSYKIVFNEIVNIPKNIAACFGAAQVIKATGALGNQKNRKV